MVINIDIHPIQERLEELLGKAEFASSTLSEAVRYALLQGGKRLRPQMLLSLSGDAGIDVACAIEMIHNYSLIHDDLPALDNDDVRRGKPTLHKQFGEATAILAGDFLLSYAFEVVAKASLPSPLRSSLIETLARYSRIMVHGQSLDIAGKDLPWEEYQDIVFQKTSSLFMASLECGGMIASLPPKEVQAWSHFGKLYGLIFQIRDDSEDHTLPFALETLGKEKIEKILSLLTIHAKQLLLSLEPTSSFFHHLLH